MTLSNKSQRNCLNCKQQYTPKNSSTKYPSKFCSQSCSANYNNRLRGPRSKQTKQKISEALRKSRTCAVCGGQYYFTPEHKRTTCSGECQQIRFRENGKRAGKIASQSPNMRRGRSRSEIYFSQLIKEKFDTVLTNKRMFDGWDADVIIPNLKIAIHWNGPCHYLPLFGKDHLKTVQDKDLQRYTAIEKCGYTNYIIDDRDNCGLTKSKVREEFDKFMKIHA